VRALVLLLLLVVGCVERKLFIRTEPEGARVRVNGEDAGASPAVWPFTHYGTVRVTVTLDGYLPVERDVRLKAPWYQYPVADFFADIVVPVRIEDDHEVKIGLRRRPELTREEADALAKEIGARAVELREELRRDAAADPE